VIYCGKGKIRMVLETLSLESLTFRKREKMKHYKKALLTLITRENKKRFYAYR